MGMIKLTVVGMKHIASDCMKGEGLIVLHSERLSDSVVSRMVTGNSISCVFVSSLDLERVRCLHSDSMEKARRRTPLKAGDIVSFEVLDHGGIK